MAGRSGVSVYGCGFIRRGVEKIASGARSLVAEGSGEQDHLPTPRKPSTDVGGETLPDWPRTYALEPAADRARGALYIKAGPRAPECPKFLTRHKFAPLLPMQISRQVLSLPCLPFDEDAFTAVRAAPAERPIAPSQPPTWIFHDHEW
jgi:hypothetical protein